MVKPGISALAIFTFISAWNDYFMQLIMLDSNNFYTIALGISTLQSETSIDMGILMAGAALASGAHYRGFPLFPEIFYPGGNHNGRSKG